MKNPAFNSSRFTRYAGWVSVVVSLAASLVSCGGSTGTAEPAPAPIAAAPTSPASPSSPSSPASTPTSGAVSDATSCSQPNFVADVMTAVNAARASARSCGTESFAATAALSWNDKLFSAAAAHSQDMASQNYFSHTSKNGTSFSARISNAGYSWTAAGENIAAGPGTVSSVINGWLNSPGHCANIMSPNFKDIGVACVKGVKGSDYPTYWTMDLGAPQ